MTKTTIKAGYRITIVSWENDADNYNTNVIEGVVDVNLAKFYCELASLHTSKNDHSKKGFGNMYEPKDKEIEEYYKAINVLIQKYPKIRIYPGQDVERAEDVTDKLYDLGLSCGEFFTRVCESVKVEFVPTDIILEDVTKEFIV